MSAQAVFDELEKRLKEDPSLVKQVNGVYLFKIDSDAWLVDLKNGSGSITKGEGKADCTVIMKNQDFVDLMTGKLSGQSAFMSGKLKIKGNMGLAMKLSKLSDDKPKAKL